MDLRNAALSLFDQPSRSFAVKLWDGTLLPAPRGAVRGQVVFRTPFALLALVPPASEQRIAERFIAGDIEIEGDIIDVIEAVARWDGPGASIGLTALLSAWLHR